MSNELQHQRKSPRSPAPIKAWPSAALPQLATTLRAESAAPEQSPAPLRARSRPSQPPQQQQQPAVVVHQQVHVSLGHDGNLLQLPMAMAVPMPQHPELPVPVPSSSTPGASKWRHRNKQQMRDGVPLLLQHAAVKQQQLSPPPSSSDERRIVVASPKSPPVRPSSPAQRSTVASLLASARAYLPTPSLSAASRTQKLPTYRKVSYKVRGT